MSFENFNNNESEALNGELITTPKGLNPEVLKNNATLPFEMVKSSWNIKILTHLKDFFFDFLASGAKERNIEFTLQEKTVGIVECDVSIQLKGKRSDVEWLTNEAKKYLKKEYDIVNNPFTY